MISSCYTIIKPAVPLRVESLELLSPSGFPVSDIVFQHNPEQFNPKSKNPYYVV